MIEFLTWLLLLILFVLFGIFLPARRGGVRGQAPPPGEILPPRGGTGAVRPLLWPGRLDTLTDPEVLLVFQDPSFPLVRKGDSPEILPCQRRQLHLAHAAESSCN